MPGVLTSTMVRSGPSAVGEAPASTFFVAGFTERGPINEIIPLRSMADYRRFFGERVSYSQLFDQLTAFFEEGGVLAYVSRTVGAAAGVGFLVLNDTAATPAPTLRVEALGPGAWSTGVTVAVATGTQANTFDITVTYGDDVEVYRNLSSPSAAVTALKGSSYVRGIDLGSATAAPANNPAVRAATALSAGADDRAAATAATHVAALDRLGPSYGAGAVAIPGQAGTAVAAGILAHCRANNRIGLLATAQTATVAQAIADKATVQATIGNEDYVGLFYPWVVVPDGAGGTREISPEGYVAGVRARTQLSEGPWRAPGGSISASRFVVGVRTELTRAEGDTLDTNEVSAIRTIAGSVRLYGWRSLSFDESNFSLLTGRDLLNYLLVEGEKRLEQFVFRSIDSKGHLFSQMEAEMVGLVEPIRVAGGLYEAIDAEGNRIDPGYSVDTGPSVNTTQTLLASEARVALAVRVAPTGSLIRLIVTKAGLTATL